VFACINWIDKPDELCFTARRVNSCPCWPNSVLYECSDNAFDIGVEVFWMASSLALLQRLAAVRGRLSLCADQAAAAKWWLSMPMASVSAEGPMPQALSTRRTSPLLPGCRHQGRACPLRRARMTSNPLIVA